jgi:transmembrane sensor
MDANNFKRILDRYSKGEASPEEEQLVQQWYDAIPSDAEHLIPNTSKRIESEIWSKISPQPAQIKRPIWQKVAAAVVLLLVAGGAAYFEYFSQATWTVGQSIAISANDASFTKVINVQTSPELIVLSDGSEVTLSPQSELRFKKNFINEKREVYLKGEAFFKVRRDESRPFLVYANEVVTKVLGTSFTVKAYQNDKQVTVAVKTGKVSVYKQEDASSDAAIQEKQLILTPNQQAVYNRKDATVQKQLVKKPQVVLPQPTLFTMDYDGAPVTRIFDVLSENYGVAIQYDEELLKNCVLTTKMSDEGLYERIEVICKAINAEYTTQDAVILIKAAGCK